MSLVDETHVQTCFVSSQDIIGATETGYLLFYEEVEWGSFGDPPTSTPPPADKVRVLPTGRSRFRRCVALLEREEASSADAVGRARAKMGALDRMRRTQFKSCSVVSIVTSQEARASTCRRCMYTGGPVSAPATGGVFVTSMSSLLFPSSRWGKRAAGPERDVPTAGPGP